MREQAGMTLVEHARRELDLLGEEPGMAACLTATVAAYASYGHSGGSHGATLPVLIDLLNYRALTPLTADPDEWIDRTEICERPTWQNTRDSRAISRDGGRTYRYVDDEHHIKHNSVAPPQWVATLCKTAGMTEDEAHAAIRQYLDAGPLTDDDRQALDAMHPLDQIQYGTKRWGLAGVKVAAILYRAGVVAELDPALPGAAS